MEVKKYLSYRQEGFILIELMIWLIIASLVLVVVINVLLTLAKYNHSNDYPQDELRIAQLKRSIAIAEDLSINGHSLKFNIAGKDHELYLVNRHLILTPGTMIIIENVDDLFFEVDEQYYYVVYYRNNHQFKKVIYEK
ncbi:MAG: hypothetical protein SPI53_02550 [Erysipelotrichaceae bacterium]|nr:hypothetical protein [Erysipelotrichaceae bacterium]